MTDHRRDHGCRDEPGARAYGACPVFSVIAITPEEAMHLKAIEEAHAARMRDPVRRAEVEAWLRADRQRAERDAERWYGSGE